jgi:tyrosyl-tRNA synthetase
MEGLKTQLSGYMEFGEDKALMIDNGDWLLDLNYIEFLRDIGRHFSVNKMLAAESYKARLETGLTFIEFNYMLLQSYDFLVLYQRLGNKLQMGGQDQWGNIVAGIDLIRRMTGGQAYGLTFPLLQDPKTGAKFGKTHSGAVWLDGQKTGPWDFFQFWRNTDDAMVEKCLGLFTFLPMDEVRALGRLEGVQINRAKEILAYEVTALRHGHEEAAKAFLASIRTFGASDPEGHIPTSSAVAGLTLENEEDLPAVTVPKARFAEGIQAIECFVLAGLTKSKGEARRLVRGGGAWAGGRRIDDEEQGLTLADLTENALVLRAGKKRYGRILVQ